jgi:surface protein
MSQRCLNWVGLLVISLAGKDSALPGQKRNLLKTAAEAGRRRQSYSQLETITASGASAAFGAAFASCAFLSGRVVALTAARPKFGSFAMVRVGVLLALADHADGRLFGPANTSVKITQTRRKLGYTMTNSNINTAVAAWLADPTAAEATYGHISTWETSGVTYMNSLFSGASSFNEDIGAWDTSGVTSMVRMFYYASAFNQPLGDWEVENVEDMSEMFKRASSFNQPLGEWQLGSVTHLSSIFEYASSFDQDLGWCVHASLLQCCFTFAYTQCASTSCGVDILEALRCGGAPFSDHYGIYTAVQAWLSDPVAAEAKYGHISTWETGRVTDMDSLFSGASSFNEDITVWDTSGVTTMRHMFSFASAFNQDISGWAVQSVTDMTYMFRSASAFDQDLGWCLDEGVNFDTLGNGYTIQDAFYSTPCASTSCGVDIQGASCPYPTSRPTTPLPTNPTPKPTPLPSPMPSPRPTPAPMGSITGYVMTDSNIRTARDAWLADATAAEATYGHISTWETGGGDGHVAFVLRF